MLVFAGKSQMLGFTAIDGKIINASTNILYLSELNAERMIIVDSAIINSDNTFSFRTQIKKANFFQLSFKQNAYTILILQPEDNLYLELDAQNLLKPAKVKGSYNTELVYEMIDKISIFDATMDSLNNLYSQYSQMPDKQNEINALASEYEKLNSEKTAYISNEIMSKPCLASMLFVDKLNIETDIKAYMVLDKALWASYSDNYFVKEMHNKVQKRMMLAPGQPAPEITLRTPDDKEIKLSSLKGQVVLIDFWASWCQPCRRANPDVVKLYQKYHAKGFEIFGVSLDKTKSDWVRAIKDDSLTWVHGSDLRYWNSVPAKNYGVDGIPFTVLVDKQGNIIATGLRDEALANKLKEIFGE